MKAFGIWFRSLELARKLILINAVFIVLPLGLMGGFAFARFSETTEAKVGESQLQAIKQMTLNIDTYMNELNRLTVMPYQYPKVTAFLESKRTPGQPLTLEEISELNNFVTQVFLNGRVDILGVSLYGRDGASYVVLPESQYVTTYKLDESVAWLDRFEGHYGEPVFVPTHDVRSTGGIVYQAFSIARELRSFDSGRTLGHIVIDVDPKFIREILSKVKLDAEESLYIADDEGKLVIRKGGGGAAAAPLDLAGAGASLVAGGDGLSQVEERGRGLLVSRFKSEVTGWTTVGVVPLASLMKDVDTLRTFLILFGTVCVGLALLLYVFIAYRVTQPLRKLSRLMRGVERGDLSQRFPAEGRDEVGALGQSFNEMTAKLSELGYLLYETEIREKDAQIAALQSKINPHFLYNTLGSISMYAEIEGNREIITMANSLSRLLRYSLSGRKERVTLGDELDHVRGYMSIQQMRYEERIKFTLEADPALLGCEVIPLLVQPLVENAINHAIDKGAGEGRIVLSAAAEGQTLVIAVADDGIGMTGEALEALREHLRHTRELGGSSGNGLLGVHRRLVLHYGEEYGLQLESMPYRGFRAALRLPLLPLDTGKEEDSDAEHPDRR
ncbi:cache domain-containing sensor histidine kinase [Paenibacillus pasadenensis]|uniref:histidine kinase n=1 Tax=Paenibacillus pasadenensis TaxID=217090 RepID=A0A2N5N9W8_9BACL|nr:sensor histidine kinase [Paenibacillus pasadenensis]PLT47114.1 Autolysin sensor kinase [Paenibacillus pasadenensis]